LTDRLSLTNALADANIDRKAAERIATEIFDAIHDNVATKQDLQHLESALKADVAAVNADLQQAEGALRADLQRVEAALKADVAAVRSEVHEIELRLEARIDRVVIRLGTLIVALTGILFAALHYWPPRG
jgi:hypothetical protein